MIKEIKCSGGIILKYDPTIKDGDLVTGYHKGYWQVIKVTERKGITPLIKYQRVDKMVAGKPVVKECDSSYCRKVDPEELRRGMIDEANKLYDKLMQGRGKN